MSEPTHLHKCGLDVGGYDPHSGCGHVWAHADSCAYLPRDEFKKEHTCPNCGRGGWTVKYEEGDDVDTRPVGDRLLDFLKKLEGK